MMSRCPSDGGSKLPAYSATLCWELVELLVRTLLSSLPLLSSLLLLLLPLLSLLLPLLSWPASLSPATEAQVPALDSVDT